jgi:hypothetical protein
MRQLPVFLMLFSLGCLSQSSLDGFSNPEIDQKGGAVFYVEKHPEDTRNFDQMIAASLRREGLNVASDPKEPSEFTVTYVDKWYWDLRMYLSDLRIDVRNTKTGALVATARSYQTSLAAMGKTREEIIDNVVEIVVNGPSETPGKKKTSASRRR